MEPTRRRLLVYGLLVGVWAVVVGWQVEEHARMREYARSNLRNRSKDIANTLGAFIRRLEFRGAVFRDRLQPVLDELVNGRTNELVTSGEVIFVAVLNTAGDPLASAGNALTNLNQADLIQEGERWGRHTLTVACPIKGVSVPPEGGTNGPLPLVMVEPPTNGMRGGPFNRRGEGRPPPDGMETNGPGGGPPAPPPGPRPDRERRPPEGEPRPRRPFWARNLTDPEFQALSRKSEMHGIVLSLSLENYLAICEGDFFLRAIITFFATISALSTGVAWRNLAKTADLQIRLVRASELNSHLKELSLAAAGLAHETRNPLNIIRGLAHIISRQPEGGAEARQKSREIINEADKVAAQLNEFINYSRPREVRPARLGLATVVNEVVRTLAFDLEEKRINLRVGGEVLTVEADEQLLRQALFNLILNAVQAVQEGGEIEVVAERRASGGAVLEIRDNGPGVAPEHRAEIFRPYFTTQKSGTGLGLAVVQQIVLAHGWEIECTANEPRGAIFRISHLRVAA